MTATELVTVEWISPALEIHKLTTTPERIAAMAGEQAARTAAYVRAGIAGRPGITRGCYCKMNGFLKGWHLRGAPECAAAAATYLTEGQLYLFEVGA